MHRTIRAALLLSLTVTAASGCVAVNAPAAPSATPTGPASAPAAKGRAKPELVQAPAHEALQRIEEQEEKRAREQSRERADGKGQEREHPREDASAAGRKKPAAGSGAAGGPESSGRHKGSGAVRGGGPDAARPHPKVPVPEQLPVPGSADVCALGERYGGWPEDSPQARICRDTYGG